MELPLNVLILQTLSEGKGYHFAKNIFPGCSEKRSYILILGIIKTISDLICTLLIIKCVEIRKMLIKIRNIDLRLKNCGLWKIIPGFPAKHLFSGPAQKIPGKWSLSLNTHLHRKNLFIHIRILISVIYLNHL